MAAKKTFAPPVAAKKTASKTASKTAAPKTATAWVKEFAKSISKQQSSMVCVAIETVHPYRRWFGRSGLGHKWADLPDALKAVIPSVGAGVLEWGSTNCAEVDAAVKALRSKGVTLKNLVFKAAEAQTMALRPPCLNCAKWATKAAN